MFSYSAFHLNSAHQLKYLFHLQQKPVHRQTSRLMTLDQMRLVSVGANRGMTVEVLSKVWTTHTLLGLWIKRLMNEWMNKWMNENVNIISLVKLWTFRINKFTVSKNFVSIYTYILQIGPVMITITWDDTWWLETQWDKLRWR